MAGEYFKNSELVEIHVKWQDEVRKADELELERPQMPDVLARAIMLIANKVVSRWNFSGYSYKDLMVSDSIEVILRYTLNFNPEKSKNLFGYWSRFCWRACLVRIQKESKQQKIKVAIIKNMDTNSLIENEDEHDISEFLEYVKSNSLSDDHEDYQIKPKNKRKYLSDESTDDNLLQFANIDESQIIIEDEIIES